jgi:hypothetical protein
MENELLSSTMILDSEESTMHLDKSVNNLLLISTADAFDQKIDKNPFPSDGND